jgi:hypothetical protein
MADRKGIFIVALINVLCLAVLAAIVIYAVSRRDGPFDAGEERDYANTLRSRELYPRAIQAYDNILKDHRVERRVRGNISFIIGDIYRENLEDYENALAYYLKAKQLLSDETAPGALNSHIVSCLEHLERSLDARRALEDAVLSGPEAPAGAQDGGDPVIARIGQREIRLSELNNAIQELPAPLQQNFMARDRKVEFLRQYLAGELFYNAAARRGYAEDEDIRKQMAELEKMLIQQKYIREEIEARIDISEADLRLYFMEHRDEFKIEEGGTQRLPEFEEVADRVAQAVRKAKEEGIYENLLQRLMKAENLEIYEDRL